MIGICSYCVLDRPVFERCQTLLNPELTPWWSFLLVDGAHHKKPHSPTHPTNYLRIMPITTALLGSVGFPSWEAPGRVHSFTISPSRNLRSGPTSVEIKGNRQQWLILIGVESQSSLQQSKTEKRLWRGNFKFYCLYRIQNVLTSNLECQRR